MTQGGRLWNTHGSRSGRSTRWLFWALITGTIAAFTVAGCSSQSATSTNTSPAGTASAAATPSVLVPPASPTATVTVTTTPTVESPSATVTATETVGGAALAPEVPQPPQPPQDDIGALNYALSSKGPKATLTSRTSNADGTITITGVIDEQGADEYCQRYERATGADLQACIAGVVAEQGTFVHQANADCATGTLTTNGPGGGTYIPIGQYTWQNADTGGVRDSSSAGGGYDLTSNFELACRGQ